MSGLSLMYQLVKDNHAARFQVRRGVQFSRESGNILNLNSARQSGYTRGAIDIRKKGHGLKIGMKSRRTAKTPQKQFKYTTYKVFGRSTNNAVRNLVSSGARPELTRVALARVQRIRETNKKLTKEQKAGKHRHVRIPLKTRLAMKRGEKRALRKKNRLNKKNGAPAVAGAAAAASSSSSAAPVAK